jgi:hypothetical protein
MGPYTPCTVTVSLPSSVASGDVVAVGVAVLGPVMVPQLYGPPIISPDWAVSDSLHSSYSLATEVVDFLGAEAALIFDATLTSSGADAVTITGLVEPDTSGVPDLFASVFEVSGVTTSSPATGTGSNCEAPPSYTGEIYTSGVSFSPGAFLLGVTASLVEGSRATDSPPFSNGPSTDYTALTEYATSGVSSPTYFPMYVQYAPACWDEAGIALQPIQAPPVGAPEFPMGVALLVTFMVPALLAIRKKKMSL